MYIRESQNSSCGMCEYGYLDPENNIYLCKAANKETQMTDSCKKFKFDIYKYKPKKKMLFGKFKKEDFEI